MKEEERIKWKQERYNIFTQGSSDKLKDGSMEGTYRGFMGNEGYSISLNMECHKIGCRIYMDFT